MDKATSPVHIESSVSHMSSQDLGEMLYLIKTMKENESLLDDLSFQCPDDSGVSYMERINILLGMPDTKRPYPNQGEKK